MLARGLAMVVIKVSKTNWRNEYGKRPAHCHCDELGDKHENGINEEHVFTHDEAYDAFIDKAGIWIKQRADDSKKQHAYWH